jgi:hypothetical protein
MCGSVWWRAMHSRMGWLPLIGTELYSAWKLRNQDRHGKEEELQRQIKLDQVERQIRVLYHLQPLCNLTNHRKWFYATPRRTLPSWTIADTASKLGHDIWTNDPSLCLHPTPTQPTRSQGNWWGIWTCQLTGTLGPSDPSFTTIDVRTFVSPVVLSWEMIKTWFISG